MKTNFVVETGLDTAKGDRGGGGEDNIDSSRAHSMDMRSDTQNLACRDKLYWYK